MDNIKLALLGNPNSGKTTLFNALTGANHYVGNWAGVTVEKKEGNLKYKDNEIVVTDLPGIYSISPYSMEEKISRNFIINEGCDIVINIVDASFIERNLLLTLQLLELRRPMIIALNMMDEAEKKNIKINVKKLSELMGIPVVPIIAKDEHGIDVLLETIVNYNYDKKSDFLIQYEKIVENEIDNIAQRLEKHDLKHYEKRWLSLKLLEKDEELIDIYPNFNEDKEVDFEEIITKTKFDYIDSLLKKSTKIPEIKFDEKSNFVDKILLNRFLGIPIFMAMMAFVFYLTFNVGGIFQNWLDIFFSSFLSNGVTSILTSLGVSSLVISLIVDGIIAGVGGVLSFVPNIAILFLAISVLEDSGYMARVALIMDKWMVKVGLSGKAFIPMILGFGCNVPAIMSTRSLENEKDRLLAILINPFMSCGARFPVYVLFSSIFFPGYETLVMFSLYALGVVMALVFAYIFRRTLFKGEPTPFIMELPPYRIPTLKALYIHVWEKVKDYITKAGTVIFGAAVVLWILLNFNFTGLVPVGESFGASIGKLIAPLFIPLGFGNWQSALSLLSGVAAKEVVVANMSILFGGADASMDVLKINLSGYFTQLSAYSFMVFVLLYTPCIAVIAVIKRETNSWKWTGFSVVYQIIVAWFSAMLVYQIGSLFIA
ncbi:ferrous iron transport protein B [Helicovermis profundi]|uniref:Ferrous iron transport protein B n=1 Tax=Helicovermis profundi TaxID=3065157 RepID=A0AAU9E0V1_9FIRM|nr:ferrous iron transport protein B [Clostridia bacterium S502]